MKHAIPIFAALLLLAPSACDDGGGGADPGADASPDASPDTAESPDTAGDATDASDAGDASDVGDVGDAEDADGTPPGPDPVDLVNPFVGTGAVGANFGALYPGATRPFGMVALSPDTEGTLPASWGVAHAGGYFHGDTEVMGFSHIHLSGTGIADYGNLLVVPAVGDPSELLAEGDPPNLALDHDLESASPGYYRLDNAEPSVRSELTATERAGLHRYTFEGDDEGLLVVDVTHALGGGRAGDSSVTLDPETGTATGFVHAIGDFTKRFDGFHLYFAMEASRAPASVGTFTDEGYVADATTVGGERSGFVMAFDTSEDPVVELRVGVSFVDEAGALANLEAEASGRGFDEVREEARQVWSEALGVVEVEGGTETRRRLLYTSLYRTMLMPNLFTDVDGRYRGLDKEVHEAEGFRYYSDFSLWDTYRTLHPLLVLLAPDRQTDFLRSLERMASDGGSMPVWPLATGYTGTMIGTSADIVIADSVDKGLTDFDVEAAYASLRISAMGQQPAGRPGRDNYDAWVAHEYVPADVADGSVSKGLEFAADDYCLSVLAEHLGHADDAEMFLERSGWWKNHWDAEHGFLAPRNADGSIPSYSATNGGSHYVEGTPWHYLFMVPHDTPGLVELLGGPEDFVAKLSTAMAEGREGFSMELTNPYFWHGNEPSILSPFLFGFGGRSDLTRYWTHWVADTAYLDEPAGLAGNDDCGTLSSWYVFAAAGIYPLTCTGAYALSAPLFDRVVWHLPGGDLEIRLGDDPAGDVLLNGAVHEGPTIAHEALVGGAVLELPPPPESL